MRGPMILALFGFLMLNSCGPSDEQLLSQSRTLMGNGEFSAVLPLLDQVIENDPKSQTAYNMRGIAKLELGQTESSIDDFTSSIELDSSDYRSFYNRGNAWYGNEDFKLAIADYDRALRLEPKIADIYLNRGNALAQIKHYTEAINDYRFALKIDDSNYQTHFNLARAYYLTEQLGDAQSSFEKCIEIYKTFAPAYYYLGMIALENDELESSCLYMTQAADLGYLQASEVLKIYCNSD